MQNYNSKLEIFILLLTVFFGLFSFVRTSLAATYYVATTGSDANTCAEAQTSATPKRTISAALACVGAAGTEAGAGNTVQVASGVYDEQLPNKIPSGSGESTRFILKSATPKGAILKYSGDQSGYGTIGFTIDSHYITIDGFVIDGSADTNSFGIYFSSYNTTAFQHIRISNNEIKNMTRDGIAMGKGNFEVIGNQIHDTGCGCPDAGHCHGIYAGPYTVNSLFEGNQISYSCGYGLHFYDAGANSMSGNIVRGNIFHHNGLINVEAGIIIGGHDNQLYNNISYSNEGAGISQTEGGVNNFISNNTIFNNTLYGFVMNSGTATLRNNIFWNNGSSITVNGGTITSSNNICSSTNTGCSLFSDPRFVNAATNDFHLQASSPAIDSGLILPGVTTDFDGVSRPQGSAYDIGAYEYKAGNSAPAAPANLRIR